MVFFSSSSIWKHSGALMSSRLMPPKVGSRSWQRRITSSGFSEFTSRSKTSISAKRLNSTPLPSITVLPAKAPILPSPRTAVPLMEGKGVLFKRFADIDVFDLEVNSENPEEVIRLCQLLEPTFGGINLEDIKAPECFQIEQTLRKTMSIPVFHDDQHGTAIISGAALLNALEVVGKDISKVRVAFNGAGASGIACAEHYIQLGVRRENILLCDTKGVVYEGREDNMNPYKARLAAKTDRRTL